MSDQMLVKAAAKSLRINPVEKDKKPDRHKDGTVRAVNSDGTYAVVLDEAPETPITCVPYCTAMVGDRVAVVLRSDGVCIATGRLGGEIGGGGEVVMTVNDASNYVAGKVFAHAGTNDPVGALLCDGRAVSRTTYWELFDAIGTTYGAGDGSSTFNLPNIGSRTIIGENLTMDHTVGLTGGAVDHTLTREELPRTYFWSYTGEMPLDPNIALETLFDGGSSYGIATRYVGENKPFNIMQPYIVMRYFITTGKGDPASGINPADYVVEWGQTGNWFWRKYASGWAEAWLEESLTINMTNPTASGYYAYVTFALPFAMSNPRVFPSLNKGGIPQYMKIEGVFDTGFNLTFNGPSSFSGDVNYFIYATGFWKDSPASGGTETIAPTIEERFEALENEAPIASGTSGDWAWIKFASGLALLFLYVIPPNANGHVAQGVYDYPFTLTSVFGQVATINDNGGNAYGALTATVKAINATDALLLSLHSVDAYFNSWLPPVTAVVVGRWK